MPIQNHLFSHGFLPLWLIYIFIATFGGFSFVNYKRGSLHYDVPLFYIFTFSQGKVTAVALDAESLLQHQSKWEQLIQLTQPYCNSYNKQINKHNYLIKPSECNRILKSSVFCKRMIPAGEGGDYPHSQTTLFEYFSGDDYWHSFSFQVLRRSAF